MTSTPIIFVDTETTGLHPDRHRVWEIAMIRRDFDEDGTFSESVLHTMVDAVDLLEDADPFALNIGGFWERYYKSPVWQDMWGPKLDHGWRRSEEDVAAEVRKFTHGAHLIGNCVGFDADFLGRLLRRNWLLPTWHYHVIDIEPLIVGFALAKGKAFPLPYSSSEISEYLNVPEPTEEERHTAMGDARWVQRQWDVIHGIDYEVPPAGM